MFLLGNRSRHATAHDEKYGAMKTIPMPAAHSGRRSGFHQVAGRSCDDTAGNGNWGGRRRVDDIFVSWASPDKPVVDRIVDQLLDAGLRIHEYSRGMRTGENIREWINEGIRDAKVVLAVVSAQTLTNHRQWLEYELTLAIARLDQKDNRLQTLALVRLGEVPGRLLPGQLEPSRVKFFDLKPGGDPGSEERLIEKLVADLSDALGDSAPLVIPAALFAMSSEEFTQFRTREKDADKLSRLAALCRSVGMPPPPGLWDELGERYGHTSSDFAPYGDGRRLIEVAQSVLRSVNRQRLEDGGKPLHLRWYSRAELAGDVGDPRTRRLRRKWEEGYSVLIVDAVSALHGDIAQSLETMPRADWIGDGVVICIPPYTRHTGMLEHLIAESLRTHVRLTDAADKWRNTEVPGLAFDIPTEISLKRWLSQLLFRLDSKPKPFLPRVRAMSNGEVHDSPVLPGMPGGLAP